MPLIKKPDNKFTQEELKNSKRIQKSATPKYTVDWYVKWIASVFILAALSLRGLEGLQVYDLAFSIIGIALWLWVSIVWKDRELVMLNGVGLLFLLRNLFVYLTGG